VRLLIDTQCWLWWFSDAERLNPRAHRLVTDGENVVCFSAASSWEIAIKASLGKLKLPQPPAQYVTERLAAHAMTGLSIEHAHALRVASLPDHHKDPFDRLIVAQAQVESLAVLTADPLIARYDIDTIWGGKGSRPW
jgi:PIN domain nuclease of toxin-antitoxin system